MNKRDFGNVIQWSDLHHPYACKSAIKALYSFSNEVKPTYHVFMGDCLNLHGISKHVQDDLIAQYEEPIIEGLIQFGQQVDYLYSINPKSKFVWLCGNHDIRLQAFVKKNPSLRGILDEPLHLLESFGQCKHAKKIQLVQFEDPEETFSIGKMSYTHGHWCGKHCACQHVEAYGQNITFGHTHTMQMFATVRAGKEPLAGYSVGHMMSVEGRKYLKGRPNRWVKGFGYLEYNKKTGNFTQHLIPIIDGKFIFNGEEYK